MRNVLANGKMRIRRNRYYVLSTTYSKRSYRGDFVLLVRAAVLWSCVRVRICQFSCVCVCNAESTHSPHVPSLPRSTGLLSSSTAPALHRRLSFAALSIPLPHRRHLKTHSSTALRSHKARFKRDRSGGGAEGFAGNQP